MLSQDVQWAFVDEWYGYFQYQSPEDWNIKKSESFPTLIFISTQSNLCDHRAHLKNVEWPNVIDVGYLKNKPIFHTCHDPPLPSPFPPRSFSTLKPCRPI